MARSLEIGNIFLVYYISVLRSKSKYLFQNFIGESSPFIDYFIKFFSKKKKKCLYPLTRFEFFSFKYSERHMILF